jgi:hypothetical protein
MLKEAKIEKNLTSFMPKSAEEVKFVDKHKIEDVTSKSLKNDNGITNASSKVKVFDRLKNRMGNTEEESIAKYESHKLINILGKNKLVFEKETFKLNDYIHMGIRSKGGAGFRGTIQKIDSETNEVHITLPKEMHSKYPKTIKGHISKCTHEEFEELSELSKHTLKSYVKKSQQHGLRAKRFSDWADAQGYQDSKEKLDKKISSRLSGINSAKEKMGKEPVKMTKSDEYHSKFTKEDINLNEISSDLVKRYVNKNIVQTMKASKDISNAGKQDNVNPNKVGSNEQNARDKFSNLFKKRDKGLGMASKKLSIESFKEIFQRNLIESTGYKPEIEFHVVSKDGIVKSKASNIKRAGRALDKHDNNYGSYHHTIKYYHKDKKQYVDNKEAWA